MRRWLGVLTLALAAVARPASAAPPGWRLSESFALSPAPAREDVSSTGFSLTVEADWRSGSGWALGAAWGASWVEIEAPSIGRLRALDPGNLALYGARRFATSAAELALALHLAAPLALYWGDSIGDKRATEHNHLTASAARGGRDVWLWQLNAVPAGLDLELDLALTEGLGLRLEAEPTALVSLNSRPSRLALWASVELAAEWGVVGGRVGWGYLASTLALENDDHDQQSAWLGVDLALGADHRVGLDVHLELDGPYGVSTGEQKPTWGLVLRARHRL